MNIITVSREYGAGGGEVAHRLAAALGWELLDRELLNQAAAVENIPDADLEGLDEREIGLLDRFRLNPQHLRYMNGLTEAVKQAVARGKVVLVGRGTRQLVGDAPGALHLRLAAPRGWRVLRMALLEGKTPEQALARCLAVERTRERFMRYFFGGTAQAEQFDLVVNTGRVALEEVTAWVLALVRQDESLQRTSPSTGARVLTLARQLGAGESGFARTLGERLRLQVQDRALLEQQALRLGVPESDLEQIDEHAPGFRQRGLSRKYFEALGQLIHELAKRGDVLLVGRGGCCFLRDHPRAFHVRLVAQMPVRLRRVMEHRWLREDAAHTLINRSDTQRRDFRRAFFGTDWADPLEYHVSVNSGRLGTAAVDLVAFAAQRFWQGENRGPAGPDS
jgi:CMP/dCMP kinase